MRSVNKQLLAIETKTDKVDIFIQRIMKFLMKYGGIAVIMVILWKFVFPETTGVRTDVIGFFGMIFLWFIIDIAIITMEMHLLLPYLLYGYYKYKYPEEYREWENKSQLEWYGEKYFNKHIKGTNLEKKMEKTNV